MHLKGVFRGMLLFLGGCVKTKLLFNNSDLHKCCGSLENTWGLVQGGENCVSLGISSPSTQHLLQCWGWGPLAFLTWVFLFPGFDS